MVQNKEIKMTYLIFRCVLKRSGCFCGASSDLNVLKGEGEGQDRQNVYWRHPPQKNQKQKTTTTTTTIKIMSPESDTVTTSVLLSHMMMILFVCLFIYLFVWCESRLIVLICGLNSILTDQSWPDLNIRRGKRNQLRNLKDLYWLTGFSDSSGRMLPRSPSEQPDKSCADAKRLSKLYRNNEKKAR